MESMKKIPITITLPKSLIEDLHSYIPRRQLSHFISQAVFDELKHKKEMMAQAFREASQDEKLNAELEIWDVSIGDGLDETNEYKAR
jgi:hypothetical protein